MPKCSRCPIKRECNVLNLSVIDKKTGLKKRVCPIIVSIQVSLNIIAKGAKTKGEGEVEVSLEEAGV